MKIDCAGLVHGVNKGDSQAPKPWKLTLQVNGIGSITTEVTLEEAQAVKVGQRVTVAIDIDPQTPAAIREIRWGTVSAGFSSWGELRRFCEYVLSLPGEAL